mgnify:CR=1 FL=1
MYKNLVYNLQNMKGKTKVIILAAGKGVRMGGDLPKVLAQVKGKPMIKYVLESVEKSGVDANPIVVVGYKKELVIKELGEKYHYLFQEKQLGTGHAVKLAKEFLKEKADNIIVLYGDHPFITPETIRKISEKHFASGKKITMATVKLPDFRDWRINFVSFSRIIRDENGKIVKDVQYKDASDAEIKVTEVNHCYFCFEAKWLWEKLEKLENNNAQKEYYLTDLIKMATAERVEIESVEIAPREALGVNTKAGLEVLERFNI